MVKTEAIVSLKAGADWRIEEIELAEPRDDELLVEMVAAVSLLCSVTCGLAAVLTNLLDVHALCRAFALPTSRLDKASSPSSHPLF